MTGSQPSTLRTMWRGAAIAAIALAWTTGQAADRLRPLAPAWSTTFAAPVEHVEFARCSGSTLLVALTNGQLHLLDAHDGTHRLRAPITAAPGVRPADTNANAELALALDRYAIYALSIDPPALRWRHGRAPAQPRAFPDDPEVLNRWVAVAGMAADVLAANSDGRLIVLNATDGAVRWQHQLGPASLVRLHVRDQRAVLIAKQAHRIRGVFLNLATARPHCEVRALAGDWPVWSGLAPGGLVTIAGRHVQIWPPEGDLRHFALDSPDYRAGACALHIRERNRHAATEAAPGSLLLVAQGPQVAAYELVSGHRRWLTHACAGPKPAVETLRVADERFVLTCAREVAVGDGTSGRMQGRLEDPVARLRTVHIQGDVLWALRFPGGPSQSPRLLRRPLRRPAVATAPTPGPEDFELVPIDDLHGAVARGPHLVLVGGRELHGYTLPE